MKIKLRLKITMIALSLLVSCLGVGLVVQHSAYAQSASSQEVCEAIGSGSDCKSSKGVSLEKVVKVVINTLSIIIGIVALIMIIVAGFKYITSGGDSGKVASAKNTLVYSIIGLIIVALAQFIVQYVIKTTDSATTPKKKTSNSLIVRIG